MKLYKIRKGKYYFITAIFLGCLILSFFNINVYESQIIGTYIDGKETEQLPTKNSGYAVEKIVCNNSQNVSWDYHKWGIKLTNLSKRGRCSVYFKTLEKVNISKVSFYVDEVQRCPTVNDDGSLKGNVNVQFTEKEYGYICSAPDAYGTSYYFRGNVIDNYVYFAGFYWRIIRINGDGSVRVIYTGTTVNSKSYISKTYFNDNDKDPAYVGYMYGEIGTGDYTKTTTNTNDSTIKQIVDNWYKRNIKSTNNEKYVVDNIFCNDRSICKGDGSTNTKVETQYCRKRTLICPQQNDAFTVNDTSKGNGSLKYPIGLISAAEASLNDYFISSSNDFWTSTPYRYGSGSGGIDAGVCYVENDEVNCFFDVNDFKWGVNPVINLKSDIFNNGTGTADDPYHV